MPIQASFSFAPSGIRFGITGLDELVAELIVDFIGRTQSSGPLVFSEAGQVVLVYVLRCPDFVRSRHVCVARMQTRAIAAGAPSLLAPHYFSESQVATTIVMARQRSKNMAEQAGQAGTVSYYYWQSFLAMCHCRSTSQAQESHCAVCG